ncbi:MAG TPA: hypothetical protein VEY70_09365 [Metabacillus sp.]|nr:hypothetical protein [Metabacillus sp.]
MALTVDNLGKTGNSILHIIGFGCYIGAILIAKSKNENKIYKY